MDEIDCAQTFPRCEILEPLFVTNRGNLTYYSLFPNESFAFLRSEINVDQRGVIYIGKFHEEFMAYNVIVQSFRHPSRLSLESGSAVVV